MTSQEAAEIEAKSRALNSLALKALVISSMRRKILFLFCFVALLLEAFMTIRS